MSFLPENYERPATSGGNYMKFEDGANKFRVLSDAKVGYLYWTKDKKPVRLKERPTAMPEDIREGDKIKHFWAFIVWSYRDSKVQILEITQASIQAAIEALVTSDDWSDPKEYDLTVTRKGKDLDTEYSVQPQIHRPLSQEARDAYKATQINLDALFAGADPFSAP